MSKEDLIPLNTRPPGEHRLIAQKGGQSIGQTKSEGQKLRQIKLRMKNQGLTNDDQKWLLEKLENRKAMAADLFLYIEQLKREGVHPSQRIALGNLAKDCAKFTHGDKVISENLNLNVNMDIAEWERRLYEGEEDEEEVVSVVSEGDKKET
jgi:hypothetical protein